MRKPIRIGTRDSELALFQANLVANKLQALGCQTTMVPIKSAGDLILDKPLYEFGITGIFTKTLDAALLANKIDLAVHSMKDVPTALPHGLLQTAVLERESAADVLVTPYEVDHVDALTIATGSLRRKAQWLHRYPHHKTVDLRGNMQTRLNKLVENGWHGGIFAAAGLSRINLLPDKFHELNWMIPAPAQGAIVLVARENDFTTREVSAFLNHSESEKCTHIERQFLRTLEGGCTAPIGANAKIVKDEIFFEGALFSLDGTDKIHMQKSTTLIHYSNFGAECAREIIALGGDLILEKIKNAQGN
jgi:hydroxymethylbilane synthase